MSKRDPNPILRGAAAFGSIASGRIGCATCKRWFLSVRGVSYATCDGHTLDLPAPAVENPPTIPARVRDALPYGSPFYALCTLVEWAEAWARSCFMVADDESVDEAFQREDFEGWLIVEAARRALLDLTAATAQRPDVAHLLPPEAQPLAQEAAA